MQNVEKIEKSIQKVCNTKKKMPKLGKVCQNLTKTRKSAKRKESKIKCVKN